MKNVTIVVSRLRLTIVAIMLGAIIFLSLYLPKNEESNKMIVELNDKDKCELLLWNDDKLVARLYSEDTEKCKFYLIKNSSR
tara:strand:+ start:4027 stop:4272 length:246 start_codon:yes stop_codon:yes gene_type:complete